MSTNSTVVRAGDVATQSLIPFLLISFGLAWGLLGMYIFRPEAMTSRFGPISGSHPLFMLAVYAPAIAAITVVLRCAGWNGMRRYLSRLLLWRCSPAWYAFLLVGIPLVFYAGAAVKGNLSGNLYPFESVSAMIAAMGFMLILGPVEELGWRGLAMPLLQRHFAPIWAALILGVIWGLWHMIAFFLSGTPQSAWGFTPFFIGSVALSVIVTPLFNSSGGSILLPALFHWQLINPLWPDAQPYDTALFVAVAVVTVWLNRTTMFTHDGAVTEVI